MLRIKAYGAVSTVNLRYKEAIVQCLSHYFLSGNLHHNKMLFFRFRHTL